METKRGRQSLFDDILRQQPGQTKGTGKQRGRIYLEGNKGDEAKKGTQL